MSVKNHDFSRSFCRSDSRLTRDSGLLLLLTNFRCLAAVFGCKSVTFLPRFWHGTIHSSFPDLYTWPNETRHYSEGSSQKLEKLLGWQLAKNGRELRLSVRQCCSDERTAASVGQCSGLSDASRKTKAPTEHRSAKRAPLVGAVWYLS